MELDIDTITFGKYKSKTLKDMLKDRKYCKWFLGEPEFQKKYEYIYNKVKEYDPKIYFLPIEELIDSNNFIENYTYFNLVPVEGIVLNLNENEKKCYSFYLKIIDEFKQKILERMEECKENPYDIKAPVKWLQRFEEETSITREEFKEFINSFELPNIPYIIEDIKKQGGIEYKGANSFIIAKERSKDQETYWEKILKDKYGEDISVQFLFTNCIFDFINISSNTIYECKLNIKDFNEEQYNKYLLTLNKYKIIYLIDKDCVIDISKEVLYTTNAAKYLLYQSKIPMLKKTNPFNTLILTFEVKEIEDIINFV